MEQGVHWLDTDGGSMKLEFNRRNRIFISFFGSYLLTLLIPILVCSLALKLAGDSMAANVGRFTASSLNPMLGQIDDTLSEIQDISYRVANDSLTLATSLLYQEDRSTLSAGMTRYVRQLWPTWFTSKGRMSRIYVFFERSRIVASPFTFYGAEDFYGTFFSYGGMSPDTFYGTLMNEGSSVCLLSPSLVTLNDMESSAGERRAVLHVRQIIPPNAARPAGAVFSLIDSDWIRGRLEDILPDPGGYGAVFDAMGRLVTETGELQLYKPEEIKGFQRGVETSLDGSSIVVRLVSARSGWKYVVSGRKSILLGEVDTMIRWFVLLLLVAVGIGAVACVLLANARMRPVLRLTGMVDPEGTSRDPDGVYGLLEHGITRILAQNRMLSDEMVRHKPLLSSLFLHRLISGEFNGEGEILEAARDMGLSLVQGSHVIVVARVRLGRGALTPEEIFAAGRDKRMLYEAWIEAGTVDPIATDAALNEIVWLFSAPSSTDLVDSLLSEFLGRVTGRIRLKGVACLFGAGSPFNRPDAAARSFQDACMAADGALPDEEVPVVWYWNLQKDSQRYEYRMETEERLIGLIRSGEREAVHTLLETIRQENFECRDLSGVMKRTLVRELEGTWVKAIEHDRMESVERLLSEPDMKAEPEERFERLCTAMEEGCRRYPAERRTSSWKLAGKVQEFILAHFRNSELGLKMVSMETGITEAYLSRIFKENINENFAASVERVRIAEACRLLADPSCKVSSVAEAVGYNSDHVFRRAFRRSTGMSPSGYRGGMGLD